jgi:hypothetical protein
VTGHSELFFSGKPMLQLVDKAAGAWLLLPLIWWWLVAQCFYQIQLLI